MVIELHVWQFWSKIILVISPSDERVARVRWWNHAYDAYDFRPNYTPLSLITIMNQPKNSRQFNSYLLNIQVKCTIFKYNLVFPSLAKYSYFSLRKPGYWCNGIFHKAMSTRMRIFLKPPNFYPDSCGRGLNHSGKRFRNNVVSVSGFIGFVWTQTGRFL